VDEVIIVVREGETARNDLLATKTALDKVDAKVAGIVFNGVNQRGKKYNYYYGETEKK
jgi:Mrp family chromosome partitioning ATPase